MMMPPLGNTGPAATRGPPSLPRLTGDGCDVARLYVGLSRLSGSCLVTIDDGCWSPFWWMSYVVRNAKQRFHNCQISVYWVNIL